MPRDEARALLARRMAELVELLPNRGKRDLGRQFGLDDKTVGNLLNPEKGWPDTSTLDKIAAKTGLSHEVILGRAAIPTEFYLRAGRTPASEDDEVKNSRLILRRAQEVTELLRALLSKHEQLVDVLKQEADREEQMLRGADSLKSDKIRKMNGSEGT